MSLLLSVVFAIVMDCQEIGLAIVESVVELEE
jgi:hypothetical protein